MVERQNQIKNGRVKPSPLCMFNVASIASYYNLGENTLDYTDCEKDLEVDVSNNLYFNEHCNRILSKANQKFCLPRRTCSFVNGSKQRRIFYLTIVRSQFEDIAPRFGTLIIHI